MPEEAHRRLGRNLHAELRRETAEEKALRIVQEELANLGWTQVELLATTKGDARKISIARRLRTETTMNLQWIADQLHMGAGAHVANRLYHTVPNNNANGQMQIELV